LELISALEPTLIPLDDDTMETAMREAMRQMMGIFSELERKNFVHKLRGARQRARLKDPSRHEGQKLFGFRQGEQETIAESCSCAAVGSLYARFANDSTPKVGPHVRVKAGTRRW
jgi:hypothetical protein